MKTCERTLRAGFQGVSGLAPMWYLKAIRLRAARHKLQCGRDRRISDVALACGFGHHHFHICKCCPNLPVD